MSTLENLIETHAEHLRKLTIAELYDGTLGLLVRDALTTAKGYGAGEERENAVRLCAWIQPEGDCSGAFETGFRTGIARFRDRIESGERAPVDSVDAPTVEAEPEFGRCPECDMLIHLNGKWKHYCALPGTAPYPLWNAETVKAFNAMEVKPPVEEANPWRKTADKLPPVGTTVRVRRSAGSGAMLRTLHTDNRWYSQSGNVMNLGERHPSFTWPEWRYIVEPTTESDLNREAIRKALEVATLCLCDSGRVSVGKGDIDKMVAGLRIALSEHDELTRKVANQAKTLRDLNDAQQRLKTDHDTLLDQRNRYRERITVLEVAGFEVVEKFEMALTKLQQTFPVPF